MDTLELILHGLVVIGCIYMGVRAGGVGLGIWGLLGVFVLVYSFVVPTPVFVAVGMVVGFIVSPPV